MAPVSSKTYDLIVFGATGYTGKLTAEHISAHLPTDLKWAIAGRSESKLSGIASELKTLNPDRIQPAIEVAALVPAELDTMVKKTKVLINTVGPYHLYSTPVVEACAKNGTHYLDVTGESPWVLDMIRKYHEIAKASGAIIIPEIGIESSPSDLLTWALVSRIRKQCQIGTKEVTASLHEMNSMPSGGSLATLLTTFDDFSMQQIVDAGSGNWSSSPIPGPKATSSTSLATRLFGVRSIPNLGTVTTSLNAGPNVAVVQRSWGLLAGGSYYGPKFQFREYVTVRNRLVGAAVHIALAIGMMALALSPVRWLLKKLVYAPGQGPSKETTAKDSIEYRAVATADQDVPNPRQAFGICRYDGGVYYLTGVFLAEASMVLLKDDGLVKRLGGGLLTPAMLGQHFIDRLTKAGLVLETEMLPEY
ncbi:MAG: hypothetical protein Q9217_002375 [Psora testacea]